MSNAWVLCVFIFFYHGNWREAGLLLPLICCHKEFYYRWCGDPRSASGFVCFLCKTLPKRLKFYEIVINMFQVKKKGTRTGSEYFSKLTIRHQNDANFDVLGSSLLTVKSFDFTPCSSVSMLLWTNECRLASVVFTSIYTEAVTQRCFSRKVF